MSSDRLACIKDTDNLDTLIQGLVQHSKNLQDLGELEDQELPRKLKEMVDYLKSNQISSKYHQMGPFVNKEVGAILEQKDLGERVKLLRRTAQKLDSICKEFKEPDNSTLANPDISEPLDPSEEDELDPTTANKMGR